MPMSETMTKAGQIAALGAMLASGTEAINPAQTAAEAFAAGQENALTYDIRDAEKPHANIVSESDVAAGTAYQLNGENISLGKTTQERIAAKNELSSEITSSDVLSAQKDGDLIEIVTANGFTIKGTKKFFGDVGLLGKIGGILDAASDSLAAGDLEGAAIDAGKKIAEPFIDELKDELHGKKNENGDTMRTPESSDHFNLSELTNVKKARGNNVEVTDAAGHTVTVDFNDLVQRWIVEGEDENVRQQLLDAMRDAGVGEYFTDGTTDINLNLNLLRTFKGLAKSRPPRSYENTATHHYLDINEMSVADLLQKYGKSKMHGRREADGTRRIYDDRVKVDVVQDEYGKVLVMQDGHGGVEVINYEDIDQVADRHSVQRALLTKGLKAQRTHFTVGIGPVGVGVSSTTDRRVDDQGHLISQAEEFSIGASAAGGYLGSETYHAKTRTGETHKQGRVTAGFAGVNLSRGEARQNVPDVGEFAQTDVGVDGPFGASIASGSETSPFGTSESTYATIADQVLVDERVDNIDNAALERFQNAAEINNQAAVDTLMNQYEQTSHSELADIQAAFNQQWASVRETLVRAVPTNENPQLHARFRDIYNQVSNSEMGYIDALTALQALQADAQSYIDNRTQEKWEKLIRERDDVLN